MQQSQQGANVIVRAEPRRIGILIIVSALVLFLMFLGSNLARQLRDLSTADVDNLQWTILQVETEIANLGTALTDAVAGDVPDADAETVRLRAEIALNRLSIVRQGAARDLYPDTATPLLNRVDGYRNAVIGILDADPDLTQDDLVALRDLTRDIRPDMRELVIQGLAQHSARTQQQRAGFSRQLAFTGGVAIVLILGLSGVLVFLNRLLTRAVRRDADLKASGARLASTVQASLDAIVTANEAGEIVEFNAAAERILGWKRADIIGQRLDATIIPPQHRAAHCDGMARYLSGGDSHIVGCGRVEMSALRRSGEQFPIELNITSVDSPEGPLFIAYLRDISDWKISEQTLIEARDRAQAMDRAKSQFLAVMSHEMRTPLNGILGVLDLLRQTPLNADQDRYARIASASGEILLEHVNEALDITRIEIGSMRLSAHPFRARETIETVIEVLMPLAQEKGLGLVLDFDADMDRVFVADGGRIGQILTNLIGNAIKFTDRGGIEVSVGGIHGAEQTTATIHVSDSGRGIPADKQEDVFEDFVALSHSKGRRARGDGLGLSISRKVARLMGGDLTVQSIPGQGSRFTLRVPLDRCGDADRVAPAAIAPADRQPVATARRGQVLVVEDNAVNRTVLRDMLQQLGQSVTEAADGLQGLTAAREQRFDLIIMDISMPVMDGIEATRRIQQMDGPNRTTRILGLTAHGREECRERARQVDMAFITKPIRLSTLREVIDGLDRLPPDPARTPDMLDPAVFGDLLDLLGPDKMRETVDMFIAEVEATLAHLATDRDEAAAKAELHKLRGAAAVLGLTGVVAAIDRVDPSAVTRASLDGLRDAVARCQSRLHAALQPDSPPG